MTHYYISHSLEKTMQIDTNQREIEWDKLNDVHFYILQTHVYVQ